MGRKNIVCIAWWGNDREYVLTHMIMDQWFFLTSHEHIYK